MRSRGRSREEITEVCHAAVPVPDPIVVPEQAPSAGTYLSLGRKVFKLAEGENVIGRSREADVSLGAASVSRRHAKIVLENGRAIVEDLGSRNGTWVNDQRVESPREIPSGSTLRLGAVWLAFCSPATVQQRSPTEPPD